jgi:hypothetical protein
VVWVWQHGRVEDPPGGVPPQVVHNNGRAGRVTNVQESVVTCLLRLVLEPVVTAVSSPCPRNLVVNHEVREQRVGP